MHCMFRTVQLFEIARQKTFQHKLLGLLVSRGSKNRQKNLCSAGTFMEAERWGAYRTSGLGLPRDLCPGLKITPGPPQPREAKISARMSHSHKSVAADALLSVEWLPPLP